MKKKKIAVFSMLFLLLLFSRIQYTTAKTMESPHAIALIQGITEESEWQGMLELGLLQTKTTEIENIEEAIKEVLPSVVGMKAGGYVGSGSIFALKEKEIILVSNKHLLMYDSEVEITFLDGMKVFGKVVSLSEQYDVGFVSVQLSDIPYTTRKTIRQVSAKLEKAEEIDYGSEIFIIGSTDGVGENIVQGSVLNPSEFFEEFGSFMLHVYAKGKPGMSGGGTFDAYGNYIGMLTGGLGEESASLPLGIIEEEYKRGMGE